MTQKEKILNEVKKILRQYRDMKLSLRQIYYRLVSTNVIRNTASQYKYLSRLLVDARHRGLIEIDAIEDRSRTIHTVNEYSYRPTPPSKESIKARVKSTINHLTTRAYEYPRWHAQRNRVILLVEKEALLPFFLRAHNRHNVTTMACKGYPSLTILKELADIIKNFPSYIKTVNILYFGDHDPSGRDIERYIIETLTDKFYLDNIITTRIALTKNQIQRYRLPPFPAKRKDMRWINFVKEHGDATVELDALDPTILTQLIDQAILQHFDQQLYSRIQQQAKRKTITLQKKTLVKMFKIQVELNQLLEEELNDE